MKQRRVTYYAKSGFTLMEILIAIFIFAIIVTTVFASYRNVFLSVDDVKADMDLNAMASNCLNRITMDLRGVYISLAPAYEKPEFDSLPDPYRIVGDMSDLVGADFPRLRFTSRTHVPLEGAAHESIAEIVYYVEEDTDGGYRLKRSDHIYPFEDFEEKESDPVVCEQLKSLMLTYYDEENTAYEAWDSESTDVDYATPKAIGIFMEIGNDRHAVAVETMILLPIWREAVE